MKWNFGTFLIFLLLSFMTLITVLVILISRESIDLVERDYYPRAINHQDLINKRFNAQPFENRINLRVEGENICITFPEELEPDKISGTVHFYQRVSEKYDRYAELKIQDDHRFYFPHRSMKGRYIARIDWAYDNNKYYTEKTFTLP